VLLSAIFGLATVIGIEAFTIRFGWIRQWWPEAPQLLITFLNPGTILTFLYAVYSVWCVRKYDSTRAGALGLFTCFLMGFTVLTIIGSYFRGPNWDFMVTLSVAGTLPWQTAMTTDTAYEICKKLLLISSLGTLLVLFWATFHEIICRIGAASEADSRASA
jgi:hypothetical protein